MKHLKLFEEYSEEHYNRVLDLYNEKGLKGMTPEEVAYLKSGGESEIPQSNVIDYPFVVSIGEHIWSRYLDRDRPANQPYTPEETEQYEKWKEDKTMHYISFVFKNYQPIRVTEANRKTLEQVDMGSPLYSDDLKVPGGSDYENRFHKVINNYFSAYDESLVYWYFDPEYPKWLELWNDYIERGGFHRTSEVFAAQIGAAAGRGDNSGSNLWKCSVETIEVDMKRQRLTLDNIIKEIKTLELQNKLGDWEGDAEWLLKGSSGYLPAQTGSRLFSNLY